ncbi:MAG: MlaD family protein [Gammaproteobacteria bacterium]|jgi:phospholipid/cholesterol/gamma-HCH transport system substrate-binding protein
METRANYLLVGIAVILVVTAVFTFFIWLAGGPNKSQYTQLMIYFPGSVSGLSPGSQVRYRGVQVGNVASISLDPQNPDQVHVLVNVLKTTPLYEDMRADLQMLGITGLSFIELTGYSAESKPLTRHDGDPYPIIYGSESALEKMMENIPVLLQSYTDVAYTILDTLNEQNRKAFSDSMKNIDEFTKALADSREQMNQILERTHSVATNLDHFSQNGLVEFEYLLRDTRQAVDQINVFTESLNDNPSNLFFQQNYEGYKTK